MQCTGITVMDENRLFDNKTSFINSKPSHRSSDAFSAGCAVRPGPDSITIIADMGAMVKRDRNHPSIIIWSFCNEAGCEGSQEQGGPAFREIAYHFDGSRELPLLSLASGLHSSQDATAIFCGQAPCWPTCSRSTTCSRESRLPVATVLPRQPPPWGRCPLWLG